MDETVEITNVRSAPPRRHSECEDGCIVLILDDESAHLYDMPHGVLQGLAAIKKDKDTINYGDFQTLIRNNMDEEPEKRLVSKKDTDVPSELLQVG